jgi:hypothetical protein
MSNVNVVLHPHHDLLAEAEHERKVVESAEGQALQEALFEALQAYSRFLDRHGLIWEWRESDYCRLKASALIATVEYGKTAGDMEICLKDGAIDRVYGNGRNPDPDEQGPSDIPHKPRSDD